jgi:predicted dehydrogenase
VLHASQVAAGEENGLRLRVYGERGGLDWRQEEPNTLVVRAMDRPAELHRTGAATASEASRRATRLPMGHPEGFIEAFANLYRDFALAIEARLRGEPPDDGLDFPTVYDGLRGMLFLEAAIESSRRRAWVPLAEPAAAAPASDGSPAAERRRGKGGAA